MKKFKNVFLLAAMAVSAVCVASCSKDDEPAGGDGSLSITAVVENGDDYNDLIDEVKVIVDADEGSIFASGKYANGRFTIVLPASVPDKYLGSRNGIKILMLENEEDFRPYKNEKAVNGHFDYAPGFMYVAENGSPLPKGWNIVYLNNGEWTTTPPSGVTYKWSFSYGN